jgi:uncharacterized membrane protein
MNEPSNDFATFSSSSGPVVAGKTEAELAKLRELTMIIYILYACGWLTGGLTTLVAIIINYVKRDEVIGTLWQSHFDWQIRTFWWSFGLAVLGLVTTIIVIGFFILFGSFVWQIYRLVKGFLNWNDNKPMPV